MFISRQLKDSSEAVEAVLLFKDMPKCFLAYRKGVSIRLNQGLELLISEIVEGVLG
jgi:hypothetical protein